MMMDMHMGEPTMKDRHPGPARQPEDREQRSKHCESKHGGGHPHGLMLAR